MQAAQHLPIGLGLGHLRIDAVLGSGGSGVTYLAHDAEQRRPVALKEYFPKLWAMRGPDGSVQASNPKLEVEFRRGLERFVSEAETLARFRHDGIVRIERVFTAMGTALMQLEFIPGPSVERWVAAEQRRPAQEEIDAFASRLLGALSTVHRAGVIHRDISPRNILLSGSGLPILIDFGSARHQGAAPGEDGNVLITQHYAPQEQYVSTGNMQGPWTDIYAAAATLHLLIRGAPPPAAPARAMSPERIDLLSTPARNHYRPQFLAAIEWALEFLPGKRPRSVEEWRTVLLASMRRENTFGLRGAGKG